MRGSSPCGSAPAGHALFWHQKLTDHRCDRALRLATVIRLPQSPWASPPSALPRRPQSLAHVSVPGAGEATTVDHIGGEDALLTRPLLAWQFIGDLQAVAVRIAEIDAERHSVISDAVDLDVLLLEPEISFPEVVEALHQALGQQGRTSHFVCVLTNLSLYLAKEVGSQESCHVAEKISSSSRTSASLPFEQASTPLTTSAQARFRAA